MKETDQSKKIREIAAQLFAEKGYNGVGVAEIGEAVGIGRGALYHHIESKENLLHSIASRYINDLVEAGSQIAGEYPDPSERLVMLSRHLMNVVSDSLAEITVCFREVQCLTGENYRTVMLLHSDYQKIWEMTIADGVEKGIFRPVQKIAIKGLLGMYFYSCLWLKPNGPQTADEIGDIFSDFVLLSLIK